MQYKKPIGIFLGSTIILYILVCLLLHWRQTRLIFIPDDRIRATPQKYSLNYQDVWINIEQEKIHGWWIQSVRESAPVLLYFHGNASNNGDIVDNAAIFHQLGLSVLLIDYRGYGKSSPTFPNETRVYQDAEAAWKYLIDKRQIEPEKIFVYGHSLGGAIAINLATKHPQMAGLIIEGTFTSIKDIGRSDKLLRWLPLDWIITQHFDSISKIKSLQTPLLMFHGAEDKIIPLSMAEELFIAAPEPKQLVIIPQAGHNNLHKFGGQQYLSNLQQFITSVDKPHQSWKTVV